MAIKEKLNFKLIWGLLMIFIYLGMFFLLVFTNMFNMSLIVRVLFGFVFFLYAGFRGYVIWKNRG